MVKTVSNLSAVPLDTSLTTGCLDRQFKGAALTSSHNLFAGVRREPNAKILPWIPPIPKRSWYEFADREILIIGPEDEENTHYPPALILQVIRLHCADWLKTHKRCLRCKGLVAKHRLDYQTNFCDTCRDDMMRLKIYQHELFQRATLTDVYIRSRIAAGSRIPSDKISPSLIAVTRELLKVKRLIKDHTYANEKHK